MKTIKNLYCKIFFVLTVSFTLLLSCENSPSPLGADIIPVEDDFAYKLFEIDNIPCQSEFQNPIVTTNLDSLIIGKYSDNVFGSLTAACITQFYPYPQYDTIVLGPNPKITSARLFLKIGSNIGNQEFLPYLNVYDLNTVPDDDIAYSNTDFNTLKGEILNTSFSEIIQSVIPETDLSGEYLAITLKNEYFDFIEDFLVDSTLFGSSNYDDTTTIYRYIIDTSKYDRSHDFRTFLIDSLFRDKIKKGFVLTAESDEASVFSKFHLSSSYIWLNYTSDWYSASITFKLYTDEFPSFNASYVEHDYSSANINISSTDTFPEEFYVQGSVGINSKIDLSQLRTIRDTLNNVVVHRADLILPVDKSKSNLLPTWLDVMFYNGDTLPDDPFYNDNLRFNYVDYSRGVEFPQIYRNGRYNSDKNAYVVNLSYYIQEYLNGNIDNDELLMYVPDISLITTGTAYYIGSKKISLYNPGGVTFLNSGENKVRLETYFTYLN